MQNSACARLSGSSAVALLAMALGAIGSAGLSCSTRATSCDQTYVEAHRAEFEAMCALARRAPLSPLPTVPAGVSGRAPAETIEVHLTDSRVIVGSESVEDDGFAKTWARVSNKRVGEPARWSLWIDPAVEVREVARVLQQLVSAGADAGELVFVAPLDGPAPEPRDPQLYQQLQQRQAELAPADRRSDSGASIDTLLAFNDGCDALSQTRSEMAVAPAGERCEIMAAGFAEGLQQCGCPAWADKQQTFAYWITFDGPPTGQTVAVPVELDASAGEARLGPGTTWGAVVAALGDDGPWPLGIRPQ